MLVNGDTKEEAADNWDLPLAAVEEIIAIVNLNGSFWGKKLNQKVGI